MQEFLRAIGMCLAAALFSLLCLPLWIFAGPIFLGYHLTRPPIDPLDAVDAQPA